MDPVTQTSTPNRRRFLWVTPPRVALASTLLIALLLFLPIRTFGPGDHEKRSCGNVLRLNLTPWLAGDSSEDYWDKAWRSCTTQRINRLAESAAVMTLTVLALTAMLTRRQRSTGPR